MITNTMPFAMPLIVKSRDYDKFAPCPARLPVFCHSTRALEKTQDPHWNDAVIARAGVLPDARRGRYVSRDELRDARRRRRARCRAWTRAAR